MLVALGPQSSFSRRFESFPKELYPGVSYVLNTHVTGSCNKDYVGHLSLKVASSGTGIYETENGRFEANTSGYLVLNANQSSLLTVSSLKPATGTIIYLSTQLVADVYRSLTADLRHLLDDP